MKNLKIAIVHDQLQEFGGAERVLIALKKIYPEADVYTSFYNPETLGKHAQQFKDWKIFTSWADKIPLLKKLYSPFRFITPWIWKYFDFSKYDLVISSSGSYMSKGITTNKPTLHICYLHHPPRYLYHYETGSLNELQKYLLFRIYANLINHSLRIWDFQSSQNPAFFIANSEETKRRIAKFYRCDATVIYPPVDIPKNFVISNPAKGRMRNLAKRNVSLDSSVPRVLGVPRNDGRRLYYLTVSRLQFAKHVDVLIQAANKYGFDLKIVGTGRDEVRLKKLAGKTVEFLGGIDDQEKNNLYLGAKAFLFASVDDEFGIAPVEAMGHGLPVIAYRSGGVPETVQDGFNGYLFDQLDPLDLSTKIKQLESLTEEKYLELQKNARKTAEKFSFEIFKKKMLNFVDVILSEAKNPSRM